MFTARRTFLAATACISAVGLLAACGSSSSSPADSDGDESSESMTLEFVTWQGEEAGIKDWWAEVITATEDRVEGLTIEIRHVESSDVPQYVTTRMGAGNPPQVLHLPVENFPVFASEGLLEPLDDRLAGTNILDTWTESQNLMEWEGSHQGVMVYGYPVQLFYNDQLLADAGVDVPTTPEELLTVAQTLTSGDVYGFGTVTTQHRDLFRQAGSHLVGFGGAWVGEDGFELDSPDAVAALDHWRQAAAFSPAGIDSAQKRELFMQGNIAMMLDGPFLIPQFEDAAPEVREHIRAARAPFDAVSNYPANGLSIPAGISDEEKDAAWEFVLTATSADLQDRFVELYDSPAARDGAGADLPVDPLLETFVADAGGSVSVLPTTPNTRAQFGEFSRIVSDGLMAMLTSDAPTADILVETLEQLEASTIEP